MRKKQVWAILLVCVLLVFSLTACNGGSADVTKLDPDALLKEVLQKMNDTQSCSALVSLVFDATTTDENGVPLRISIDADATISAIMKPSIKEKLDINIVADVNGEKLNIKIQMYLVEENGQMKVYLDIDAPSAANEEMMKSMPFKNGDTLGSVEESTADTDMNTAIDYLSNPEIIGLETVDGKETIHMQANLDTQKIIKEAQVSEQESMTAENAAALNLALRMLGHIQLNIWMDATTHDPVKAEVDLGDQLDSILEILMPLMEMESEGAGVRINEIGLKLTLSDFNAVQDFEVPVGLKASKGTKSQT